MESRAGNSVALRGTSRLRARSSWQQLVCTSSGYRTALIAVLYADVTLMGASAAACIDAIRQLLSMDFNLTSDVD